MDKKRLMNAVLLTMVIVAAMFWFQGKFSKPPATTMPTTQDTTTATGPATSGPTSGPSSQAAASVLSTRGGTSTTPILLGSDVQSKDNPFKMQLSLSPKGGGLNQVLLNEFDATSQHKTRYVFQTPVPGFEETSKALTFRYITIDGKVLDLTGRNWIGTSDDHSANLNLDVMEGARGESTLLEMKRQYTLEPSTEPGQGYEVVLTQTIENKSSRPLNVDFTMEGPTAPPREIDNHEDRQIVVGYDRSGHITAGAHLVSDFSGTDSVKDLTNYKDGARYSWIGASSAYFDALLRPMDTTQFVRVEATALEQAKPVEKVAIRLISNPVSLAPGQTQTVTMKLFMGPKKRSVLQGPYYSQLPMQYGVTLTTIGSSCTFCTFDWMVDSLVWLLSAFHFAVRDWGLAIILLVVLVRLVLHPITKRSTISMQKMGKMGPEIERLKKKYGDDKESLNREMMQVYKEQGATPILGCLPMFLQMPIWIALWSCLQNTFELRQMPFLYGMTWIKDLAHADRLIYFPNHPVNLLVYQFDSITINLLPVLMGIVYYLQQKWTPKPPAMTEQQQTQQKMMGMMTLIFPLFLYNLPSGLNLYMVTSSTLGIIETKRIRDHIKRQEEAETAGKVFVDTGPTRASKQMAKDKLKQRDTVSEAAKGGLSGWVARMQQRAEELRKEADRRKKNDDRRK